MDTVVAVPAPCPPVSTVPVDVTSWEVRHLSGFRSNLSLTHAVYSTILPSIASTLHTVHEEMGLQDVISLIHHGGAGVHMLGQLWAFVDFKGCIKTRMATEMVARAAKKWLHSKLLASPQTDFDSAVLGLFRSLADPQFITQELVPVVNVMFGALSPPLTAQDVAVRSTLDRVQILLSVRLEQGCVVASPKLRTVRLKFALAPSDEGLLAGVASKCGDGIAATLLTAAMAQWTNSTARFLRVVEHLRKHMAHDTAVC